MYGNLEKIFNLKTVLVFILFYVVIFSYVYIGIKNSGAYAAAIKYMMNNDEIINSYGKELKIYLHPIGMSLKERGDSGSSNFTVIVKATNVRDVFNFKLVKSVNRWQVLSMHKK